MDQDNNSKPGSDNSAPIDFSFYSSFLAYQAPLQASFIAAMHGLGPGPLRGAFTFGQLGTGNIASLAVLAECYPEAQFIGIDPDPSVIAAAEGHLKEAGIGNVTVKQGPLTGEALPPCDIIAPGRLYSALPAQERAALVRGWANRLKPGGLLCLQYGVLPGAASTDILFNFLREMAASLDGDAPAKIGGAVARAVEMARGEAFVFRQLPAAAELVKRLAQSDPALGAREIFNTPLHAVYVTDVMREIEPSGLVFAGHGQLPLNLLELGLPQPLRAGAESMKTVPARELYLDYARNAQARVDLYAKPLPGGPRDPADALSDFLLMRLNDGPETLRRQKIAQNTGVDFTAGLYTDLLDAIGPEPRSIGTLLEEPSLRKHARARVLKAVQLLLGTDLANLARIEMRPNMEPLSDKMRLTSALNTILLEKNLANPEILPFSTPLTGQRLVLNLAQRINLHALLGGALEPVYAQLEARGLQLTDKDGKRASLEEFKASITSELPKFRAQDGAYLQAVGVLAASSIQ